MSQKIKGNWREERRWRNEKKQSEEEVQVEVEEGEVLGHYSPSSLLSG